MGLSNRNHVLAHGPPTPVTAPVFTRALATNRGLLLEPVGQLVYAPVLGSGPGFG